MIHLPNGFTQLEYLESTGTQYIDTGIIPTAKTSIEISGIQERISTGPMFGISQVLYCFDNKNATHYGFFGINSNVAAVIGDKEITLIMGKDSGIIVNGEKLADLSSANETITTDKTCVLFGRRDNNTGSVSVMANHRIYYCKLWQDKVLVRDFVPARRNADSELGLYDTVGGTFYTNVGSGTFVAGAEIIVPAEPVNPIDPNSLLQGYLVGCRLRAMRSKKEPVAYLYNGVRLPKLPEWDTEGYPNAVIFEHGLNSDIYVPGFGAWVSEKEIFVRCRTSSAGDAIVEIRTQPPLMHMDYGHGEEVWDGGSKEWTQTSYVVGQTLYNNDVQKSRIVWANHDIFEEDGTLYFAKCADPIPVYE